MTTGQSPLNEGFAAAGAGDFTHADAIAGAMLARNPDDAGALQLAGFSAFRQGRSHDALKAFIHANRVEPGQPQVLLWLGLLFKERGDFAKGERAFADLIAVSPGHGEAWCNLAEIQYLTDRKEPARASMEKALAVEPGSAIITARAARFFEILHDMERARSLSARAFTLDPSNEVVAIAALEIYIRDRRDDEVVKAATPLLQSGPGADRRNQARLHRLIATAQDRRGDHGAAFTHYVEANRLQALIGRDAARETPSPLQAVSLDRLIRHLDENDPAAWRRHEPMQGPAPVFLLGFVRSGTTWLDQILSSHPRIIVMEEEDNFIDAWRQYSLTDEGLSLLPTLSREEIARLRDAYWTRSMKALAGRAKREFIIDKMPLNTAQLALIWRLFPEAKIIFAVRDPRDAVFSAFQQHFQVNAGMAHFLDIAEAAAFYDRVMMIGEKMRAAVPFMLHEVRYENLVADFDSEISRILDFLGVEWNDDVRHYQATALARTIKTASARQVTEKPFDTSIGKWRRYRAGMAPALPILARWVRKFGYPAD